MLGHAARELVFAKKTDSAEPRHRLVPLLAPEQ